MNYETPTAWITTNNASYGSPDGWESEVDPGN